MGGLLFERAERKIFYSKQRVYEYGERAGRLLAYLAHLDHRPPTVVSLRSADGVLLTDPDEVVGEFRSFFASLYSSGDAVPRGESAALLADIELPVLSGS